MDDNESRQLLIDSGVPEEMIDRNALNIASAIGDGVARAFAKKVVEKLIEAKWPEMIREMEAARYRFEQLGIRVEG